MRRTVNDIEALCSYEAHEAIESDVVQASNCEWSAGQMIRCDVDEDPHRLTRLSCHDWVDYTNYDVRYEDEPKAHATLTEQGAKMLTYYTRALADVKKDELVLEDGVHPFLERTDTVWEMVTA